MRAVASLASVAARGADPAAGFTETDALALTPAEETELILFDVAMDFETPYRLG